MRQRQMLPGESVVSEWNAAGGSGADSVVLTNVRVWIESQKGGIYTMTSIAADEVQWAGLRGEHNILWLVLAAFFGLVGLGALVAMRSPEALGVALVFAALCVLAYFLTRSVRLTIGGGLATISTAVRGGAEQRKGALAFVEKVEQRAIQLRATAVDPGAAAAASVA